MLDPTHYWYRSSFHVVTLLLMPFAWIFGVCAGVRRWLYRVGIFKSRYFTIPIIVIGNIVVGGTGKTPFVIWMVNFLRSHGYRPGIVSRGYGGQNHAEPFLVQANSSSEEIGDEAILLARHTNCPVMICADRVAGVRELLRQSNCNIVISDDGLQHYRLGRAIEIAIVDGKRRFGNQHLLPAGPLREPIKRLDTVDFVIINEGDRETELTMKLNPVELVSLKNQNKMSISQFTHKKVHGIAGIGHPERFFETLRRAGWDVIPHAFPDHYRYSQRDLDFDDNYPIVMTEKDAVKCESFADERYWYLTVAVNIDDAFQQKLLLRLQSLPSHYCETEPQQGRSNPEYLQ